MLLFNIRPLKSTDDVRNEIRKIVGRQKKGSSDDLTAFRGEIEQLLSLLEFKPEWKKMPIVARAARIERSGIPESYVEDVVLPDTKHDLDLVIKMLNYIRMERKLQSVKMPLFLQPDEISFARKEGKITFDGGEIISQISVVIQKGSILFVGFVFGRNFVILQD